MPKTTTLVKILKDGTRKGSAFSTTNADGGDYLPAIRDHYTRIDAFWRKKHPKSEKLFVDTTVAGVAINAKRDEPLGILDSITREFITFWMPELELLLDENTDSNLDTDQFKKITSSIEQHVVMPAKQVDIGKNDNIVVLRDALVDLATSYVTSLFEEVREFLSLTERERYDPKQYTVMKNGTRLSSQPTASLADESISEARILNSAIAWDVSERATKPESPVKPRMSIAKRQFSEAFLDDGPDPADNGAIWDTYQTNMRPKFEVKISQVIEVSEGEDEDQMNNKHSRLKAVSARRVLKPVSRSNVGRSSLSKLAIVDQDAACANNSLMIPGALKASDENCIIM